MTAALAMMMKASSPARARVRRMAVASAASVAWPKRAASRPCALKACTTGMAPSTSPATALVSATRSWLARDSRRTRRPNHMAGSTTHTTAASTWPIIQALVHTSMTTAPSPVTALRSPIDSEAPTTDCTSVVSVVRRESTSPTRVCSKNAGGCASTRQYTALRKSAVTRSPSQLTM
jgi:hypothetical protein